MAPVSPHWLQQAHPLSPRPPMTCRQAGTLQAQLHGEMCGIGREGEGYGPCCEPARLLPCSGDGGCGCKWNDDPERGQDVVLGWQTSAWALLHWSSQDPELRPSAVAASLLLRKPQAALRCPGWAPGATR